MVDSRSIFSSGYGRKSRDLQNNREVVEIQHSESNASEVYSPQKVVDPFGSWLFRNKASFSVLFLVFSFCLILISTLEFISVEYFVLKVVPTPSALDVQERMKRFALISSVCSTSQNLWEKPQFS